MSCSGRRHYFTDGSTAQSKMLQGIATDCIQEAREMGRSNMAEVFRLLDLENIGATLDIGKAKPKPGN